MRVFLKCMFCRHALATDDRHHHSSHVTQITREEWVGAHDNCQRSYDFWISKKHHHRTFCHLEDCDWEPIYPFYRYKLPTPMPPTRVGSRIKPRTKEEIY